MTITDVAPSDKQTAQSVIDRMPDHATTRQILNEIALLAAIRKSEAQIESGDLIPHEEVVRRSAQWITKSSGPAMPEPASTK
jgi:predicted transcriptional regulator